MYKRQRRKSHILLATPVPGLLAKRRKREGEILEEKIKKVSSVVVDSFGEDKWNVDFQ